MSNKSELISVLNNVQDSLNSSYSDLIYYLSHGDRIKLNQILSDIELLTGSIKKSEKDFYVCSQEELW